MKLCIAASLVLACVWGAPALAHAEEACIDFKWDVRKERALYARTPKVVRAGTEAKSAPVLALDRLYRVELAPQSRVKFAVTPAKSASDEDRGGLALIQVPLDGSYRVSLDLPLWIDVVANGDLLKAKDYQGQHDCSAPHKIVVFELSHGQPVMLQLSRATADTVLITLTAAPLRLQ